MNGHPSRENLSTNTHDLSLCLTPMLDCCHNTRTHSNRYTHTLVLTHIYTDICTDAHTHTHKHKNTIIHELVDHVLSHIPTYFHQLSISKARVM